MSGVLKPLSSAQERRLTTYIDEHLLEIEREYKKRDYSTSTLRTVNAYLQAIEPLLTLTLLIPPAGSSAPLRSSLLLRLTGEIFDSVTGYVPDSSSGEFESVLEVMRELDRGWVAVLRAQRWNAEDKMAIVGELQQRDDGGGGGEGPLVSQTDRARLRSLISWGTDKLEEWIETVIDISTRGTIKSGGIDEPMASMMVLMSVQQSFDDVFMGTLSELGELKGNAL